MVENQVPHNWLENIVIQVAVKLYRVKNDYDRFSRVAARLHVVLAHHALQSEAHSDQVDVHSDENYQQNRLNYDVE